MAPIATPAATDAKPANPGACEVHRVVITPSAKGHRDHFWDGWFGGELIVEAKIDPGLAACRVLEARGLTGVVETWHRGAPYPSMRIKIAAGAKLAVTDGGSAGTRFVKWKPFVGVGSDSPSLLCGDAKEADLGAGGMAPLAETSKTPPAT